MLGYRRVLRAAAVLLATATLATGCGADDPVPTAAATAAATPTAALAPPRTVAPGVPSAGALAATTRARTPSPTRAPATPPPATTPATARPPAPAPPAPAGPAASQVGEAGLYGIDCGRTEAEVAASGAPRVRRGTATVYAGAQQVGGNNQDPRVIRFDGGRQTWCRTDLERSGDDGRAYGLLWSGDTLLVVFSAVGTQGEPSGDLRRFTGSGWLTSYSDGSPKGGGGKKAAAIVRLDPATGAGVPGNGTWITADNNGKVNSAAVTALAPAGSGVRVTVDSWFLPRGADRKALTCTGSSPFTVTYTFDAALRTVTALTKDPRCR